MQTEKPKIKSTKVDVPAPPLRTNRMQFLQQLPETVAEAPPANLAQPSLTKSADLNFKVTEEFHRTFKAAATLQGISMKELLEEAFGVWAERNQMAHVNADVRAGVVQQRSRGRLERQAEIERQKRTRAPVKRTRRTKADPAKPDMFRGD